MRCPRVLTAWQLYMHKKRDAIQQEFERRWASTGWPDSHMLKFRCELARQLLEAEGPVYCAELQAELDEMNEAEKEGLPNDGSEDGGLDSTAQEKYVVYCTPGRCSATLTINHYEVPENTSPVRSNLC